VLSQAGPTPLLVWGVDLGEGSSQGVAPSGRILDEFVRLPLRSDFPRGVLDFAKRYGVLGICRHDKPQSHRRLCLPRRFPEEEERVIGARKFAITRWFEPVSAWRRYSAHMRALLMIAGRLQNAARINDADWEAFLAGDPPPLPRLDLLPAVDNSVQPVSAGLDWRRHEAAWTEYEESGPDFVDGRDPGETEWSGGFRAKHALQRAVDTWLRYGRVSLTSMWLPQQRYAQSHLAMSGVTGFLAVELLAAMQGPLYVCAGCGTMSRLGEERERSPRRDTRFWCTQCGRRAQKREADRKRYLRKKGIATSVDSQTSGGDSLKR